MKENAVTIIELLIVGIMIAILAAIAVPVYTYKIERTRGDKAISNIELIKDAFRQYYIKNIMNNPAPPPIPAPADLTQINQTLNLELADTSFDYSITYIEPPDNFWRIQADRNSGVFVAAEDLIRYNIDPRDGIPEGWDTTAFERKWKWHPS